MSERRVRSVAELFDNLTLSDVKIRLINDGQMIREWNGHKATLCLESDFFRNVFTGGFQEAGAAVIEVYDDVPEHFDIMLKFVYNNDYDHDAIEALDSNEDPENKGVTSIMGLLTIADKYGMLTLVNDATTHLRTVLSHAKDFSAFEAAIKQHYKFNPVAGTVVGQIISSALVEIQAKYLDTEDFERLTLSHNAFAADVILALKRHGQLELIKINCSSGGWGSCACKNWVNVQEARNAGRTTFGCTWCSDRVDLPQ